MVSATGTLPRLMNLREGYRLQGVWDALLCLFLDCWDEACVGDFDYVRIAAGWRMYRRLNGFVASVGMRDQPHTPPIHGSKFAHVHCVVSFGFGHRISENASACTAVSKDEPSSVILEPCYGTGSTTFF